MYEDITITGEWLQNLGLCSALRAFEQGGTLSCYTCCDTGPRFSWSHPKDRPIQSRFTTHKGMWRIYSNYPTGPQDIEHISQDIEQTPQDIEQTSQDFEHKSQDFEHTSQDFEHASQYILKLGSNSKLQTFNEPYVV
jgi:hypothetical protein